MYRDSQVADFRNALRAVCISGLVVMVGVTIGTVGFARLVYRPPRAFELSVVLGLRAERFSRVEDVLGYGRQHYGLSRFAFRKPLTLDQ